VAAGLECGAVLVCIGHVFQPIDDAQCFAVPHRLDASVPAQADSVDALSQFRQREDGGRFQVASQGRVQSGGDRVAGLWGLGNRAFEPAQRFQLASNQARPSAQALRRPAAIV